MAKITYEHETDGEFCGIRDDCAFYYEGDELYIQSDNCSKFGVTLEVDLTILKKDKLGLTYYPLKRCDDCIKQFGK